MSTDPVPSLALPAPATSAATPATSLTQSAALLPSEQASSTASQKHLPSVTPQPIPSQQQPPQQHVTANHPASIAAAATVALSATLLNPNEWNALASTSMVTLDDLRSAFLEQRQQQLKDLERTHREGLRELLFMSETFDKEEIAGSPWKLGQTLQVSEDDAREHVKSFLDEHHLALDMKKSIKDHVLEQPKLIRQRLSQELKTGPIEVAPPPTPTSATPAGEVQRDRDLRREVEQSNLHRSQAVARAAAAVQARAIAEGVAKIKPLTITAAETQGVRVAPLQPGQVPSFVIESSTPIAPILSGIDSSATGTVDANTQNLDVQTSIPAAQTSTPAIKVESTDHRDASPSKPSSALERAVSPVPGLARNASSQSTSLRVPPSPMVVPTVPENIVAPPLHPTLQVLAPNPLSVTYAASLRPLPPDPTRRITGAGVSGGAIHHRSGRKLASSLSHSNANSYSSIAAAKIGPAGSGQTDLYRWYVRARASPGAGMVGKADKCLMTSDWKVAFNEQRFVRAMARIEKLKAQGEWSFRQPKKQKGPVVRKSHWDHLLEEMKWLQTDFREERRWKMTVAFHLAHEVAAWHRARSAAERAAFCVSVQRPYRRRTVSENVEQRAAEETVDDVEMPDSTSSTQVQSDADATTKDVESVQPTQDADVSMDGGEEADEADEAVTEAVENALETTDQAANARVEMDADGEDDEADADADDVEAATAALVSGEPAKPPVVQVVREPLPQPEPMPALSAAPVSTEKQSMSALPAHTEAIAAADGKLANALRSELQDADSTLTAELPPQLLATLRAPIFSTSVTTTIVSPAALLESLDPEAAAALLGIEVGDLSNAADLLEPGSLSFSKMFPELPLYGGVSLPDSNSKSDRRWDEGSLNQPPRLTHVTKLLDSRPLLVSTLEPSKNRANGRWLPDSDWIVAAEQSDPLRGVADGVDAGLPPLPGSLLFARKSNRAAKDASGPISTTPAEPAQPDARAAFFMWTPDEDSYLMTLAKQYHNNWALVADLFNSTRLNTATDKREPWDCYDRCKRIEQAAAEGKPPPGPPPMPAPAVDADKDGKKGEGKDGEASNAKRDKLSKKMGSKYDGSKRKQRRSNLMEVMRKSAKRREASKQAQQTQQTKKVNLNTHETHAQIKAGPAITPQSLSALKNERDQAALRQFYEQQRAQMAYQQQQQQQQRLLAQQAQAQRMAQQQGGASTPGQAAAPAAQAGKPGAATAGAGAAGAANLTLPIGSTTAALPGATAQAQQKNIAGATTQQSVQQTPQQQGQQPAAAQMQTQQSQQQPTQQQQQQVQAQLQSQLQASQAAQMQTLYAQIQQQQQQQQQQRQQTQQLNQAANLPQVRPAVGPLTQQQLATLTPQQQQQYHAQLAAATAAAAQQQQLRNQMAAVAAAQQGGQIPMNQFQLMQQQQQQQQQGRPMQNPQQQQQQQAAAAALQMYQQQQRQAAQVQAQAQMRAPGAAGQAQQFAARPGGTPRPASGGKGAGQGRPSPSPQPSGMPATVQALQQQLAISLATSNLSPEQINGLAIQLYKQAQQQGSTNQAAGASGVRPPAAGATAAGAGAGGRPPQQVLNQAIQALAAQNQKNQQQAGAAAAAQNGAAAQTGTAGGSPVRPPTPRPS